MSDLELFLQKLTPDVVTIIVFNLNPKDLASLRCSSKIFRTFIDQKIFPRLAIQIKEILTNTINDVNKSFKLIYEQIRLETQLKNQNIDNEADDIEIYEDNDDEDGEAFKKKYEEEHKLHKIIINGENINIEISQLNGFLKVLNTLQTYEPLPYNHKQNNVNTNGNKIYTFNIEKFTCEICDCECNFVPYMYSMYSMYSISKSRMSFCYHCIKTHKFVYPDISSYTTSLSDRLITTAKAY
jgi:hypothetical protein